MSLHCFRVPFETNGVKCWLSKFSVKSSILKGHVAFALGYMYMYMYINVGSILYKKCLFRNDRPFILK